VSCWKAGLAGDSPAHLFKIPKGERTVKVAQRNDGNVLLDEVCRMNDLQPSCRIVGQNLENLKDAKQTGFRPKANFVQRAGNC